MIQKDMVRCCNERLGAVYQLTPHGRSSGCSLCGTPRMRGAGWRLSGDVVNSPGAGRGFLREAPWVTAVLSDASLLGNWDPFGAAWRFGEDLVLQFSRW